MSDSSELLILGLVRLLQPVHGYDVRRELMSWQADKWGGIKAGSIYHGLRRLHAKKFLEVTATERVENRPERTSYQVTARGEAQFQQLLRKKLWTLEPVTNPFFSAWSFLPVLPTREAAAMLRNRAAMLRDEIAYQVELLTNVQHEDSAKDNFMPRHVAASLELSQRLLKTNEQWCEENAAAIEAQELYPESEMDALTPETKHNWKAHIDTLDSRGRQPKSRSKRRAPEPPE